MRAHANGKTPSFSDYANALSNVISDNTKDTYDDIKTGLKNILLTVTGARLTASTYNDANEYAGNMVDHAKNAGRQYEEIQKSGGYYNDVETRYKLKQTQAVLKLAKDAEDWVGVSLTGVEASYTGIIKTTVARASAIHALAGTMGNQEVRVWYLSQEAKIPTLISEHAPSEIQAKQAFALRNQFRTDARMLMSDRVKAADLDIGEPNSYKNQPKKIRDKATEIANELWRTTGNEGEAIATGLKQARAHFAGEKKETINGNGTNTG